MTRRRIPLHPACHRAVKALYSAMQDQGLNKRDTCQRAGLNREQLYRWTTGKYSPRIDDLEAMLNVVGLRLAVEPLENPKWREVVEQFRTDYRTEGCANPKCGVCRRSREAEEALDKLLAEQPMENQDG